VSLLPRKPIRGGARLVPDAAGLVFLAIPVAALTGKLPMHLEIYAPWRLVLLEAAAVVVGLRLIGRWLTEPTRDGELLLLPLALLGLVGLDLGEAHQILGINWEGWLALALCLLLIALAWLDGSSGGLDRFRVPDEIWRVDRISAGEN
jgi:hypothetical protein